MEIQDYDWEFLTILYMVFKFDLDSSHSYYNGATFGGNRCSFESFKNTRIESPELSFGSWENFTQFMDRYISVIEKYIPYLDWNVIINSRGMLWGVRCFMYTNPTSHKKYNDFIEKYRKYIPFDKIKMGGPTLKYDRNISNDRADSKYKINYPVLSILIEEIDKISII